MFRNEFESLNDLLLEGHKLLTKSFLIFGFFLVVLAGVIFMFPAIIGMLFAIFIFLAGLFVLVAGYYFLQTNKRIQKLIKLDYFLKLLMPSFKKSINLLIFKS